MFDDILLKYEELEPAQTDAWNPLVNEKECWARMRIFQVLGSVLTRLSVPIADAKILDVGCGVGHSTRVFVEFGARPENLVGIDLRSSAITYAQSTNPAIQFRLTEDFDAWPPAGTFDLCVQIVVFSSIAGSERRLALAQMMEKAVKSSGLIFWWDRLRANDFAGGDMLEPGDLFRNSTLVDNQLLSGRPNISEAIRYKGRCTNLMTRLAQKLAGYPATHCAALFRKSKKQV